MPHSVAASISRSSSGMYCVNERTHAPVAACLGQGYQLSTDCLGCYGYAPV